MYMYIHVYHVCTKNIAKNMPRCAMFTDGCTGVKKISLLNCRDIGDNCIAYMLENKDLLTSLEHLEIANNRHVSSYGVLQLAQFRYMQMYMC